MRTSISNRQWMKNIEHAQFDCTEAVRDFDNAFAHLEECLTAFHLATIVLREAQKRVNRMQVALNLAIDTEHGNGNGNGKKGNQ